MKTLPICTICQDDEKPSLSKTKDYGWMCDDCISDMEHYEKNSEEHEERRRKRIFNAQEY
jgi:hypothetical protein